MQVDISMSVPSKSAAMKRHKPFTHFIYERRYDGLMMAAQ
jgi:hypothetical protein